MKTKCSVDINKILSIVLGVNTIFMFLNPDVCLGVSKYYYGLLMFLILGLLQVIRQQRIKSIYNYPILGLIAYATFSAIYSIAVDSYTSGYIFSYFLYLFVLFVAVHINFSQENIAFIINCYIISALIIALLLIVNPQIYYISSRHTIQVANNDAFDPNMLSAYLVVPGLMSFAKVIKKWKWYDVICVGIIAIGVLMTASRGAMLSLALGMIVIVRGYLCEKGHNNKKIRLIFTMLIIAICVLAVIPEESYMRLFVSSYDDQSNHYRLLNWKAGIEAIVKRPLLGYGMNDETTIIINSVGINRRAHNTYLGLILQFGLLGMVPIIFFIFRLYKKIKENYVLVATLISTLAVVVFISAVVDMFLWLPIIYMVIISGYENRANTINTWL